MNLTSAAGNMTMAVIAAVAEFGRDLLVERTQSGLARPKAAGKALGRPSAFSQDAQEEIMHRRLEGVSLGVLAKRHGVSRAAIRRVERRRAGTPARSKSLTHRIV